MLDCIGCLSRIEGWRRREKREWDIQLIENVMLVEIILSKTKRMEYIGKVIGKGYRNVFIQFCPKGITETCIFPVYDFITN